MKLALIGDLHFGIRNDGVAFLDNNKKFFDNVFFPYLEEHKIKEVICLGDLLDRRKYVNYNTASRLRKDFLDPITSGYNFYWILGNHDIYHRNLNDVSAASELLGDIPNVSWYKDPTEVMFGDTKILFVPWICESNEDKTKELLKTTDARIVFGHLELAGFEMNKGVLKQEGEDANDYVRFDVVCTGHYHHKSSVENIHYLGAHAEFTWADCDDDRGFHIFDTETRKLEFIRNPYTMFQKVYYDDANPGFSKKTKFQDLKGKMVKVIIKSQTNSEQFNWFMSKIEEAGPLEITILQDHLNLADISDETMVSETKDTLTIMREYIAQVNNVVNIERLDKLVTGLYQEAHELDNI